MVGEQVMENGTARARSIATIATNLENEHADSPVIDTLVVTLAQQQFSQVGSVLSRDAGNQGSLGR